MFIIVARSHLHGRGSNFKGGAGIFQEYSAGTENCRWPLQSKRGGNLVRGPRGGRGGGRGGLSRAGRSPL